MNNKYKPYSGSKIPDFSDEDWFDGADTDPNIDLLKEFKNFKNISEHKTWLLIEHEITKERKWVERIDIIKEGIQNAFYDADIHFCPPGVSKWN